MRPYDSQKSKNKSNKYSASVYRTIGHIVIPFSLIIINILHMHRSIPYLSFSMVCVWILFHTFNNTVSFKIFILNKYKNFNLYSHSSPCRTHRRNHRSCYHGKQISCASILRSTGQSRSLKTETFSPLVIVFLTSYIQLLKYLLIFQNIYTWKYKYIYI